MIVSSSFLTIYNILNQHIVTSDDDINNNNCNTSTVDGGSYIMPFVAVDLSLLCMAQRKC